MRNLSMNGKLLLLTGVYTFGFLVFGALTFSTLNVVQVDGPHYNRIVSDKTLMADFLPPPAFIIESSWFVQQIRDTTSSEQLANIEANIARLKSEYDASLTNWNNNVTDSLLRDELIGKSQAAARSFFKSVEEELIPAAKAKDNSRIEALLAKLDTDFKAHYNAINHVVERNKEIEAADQALATSDTTFRTRLLGAIGLLMVGAIAALTLWIRKSILAQDLRNADFAGQIAAIHRSQAVIEFDLEGNILTANENFLNTMGYSLEEIKGRHPGQLHVDAALVQSLLE